MVRLLPCRACDNDKRDRGIEREGLITPRMGILGVIITPRRDGKERTGRAPHRLRRALRRCVSARRVAVARAPTRVGIVRALGAVRAHTSCTTGIHTRTTSRTSIAFRVIGVTTVAVIACARKAPVVFAVRTSVTKGPLRVGLVSTRRAGDWHRST